MGTQATGDVEIPVSRDEKDVDLATPPELETSDQLSDTRLFILGAAFFALWAGNVGYFISSSFHCCNTDGIQSSSVLQTATMLPVIQKEFGVSRSQVQWVAASNTIVWVSLVTFSVHYLKLLVGIVADRGWKML
jgi:hypothetical protein